MRPLLYGLVAALGLFAHSAFADYSARAGSLTVGSLELTWTDAARSREVPVKIYFPKTSAETKAPFPVIIFSHGLGGSREGYSYLGEHWASYGYVSVHVQHRGSDKDVLRGMRPLKLLRVAASDPANAINRPRDISFVIDQLTSLNADASFPLHGQLDLARVGVAGHSFGAFTTMAVAGAHIPALGDGLVYLDKRVKAAIAMSTPTTQNNDTDEAFEDVRIPIFHMTGSKDEAVGTKRGEEVDPIVGNTKSAERLRPYRHTKHAPAYLLVFEGGDHMVFSGRLTAKRPTDQAFQDSILAGSTAFWDAWLKDDKDAKLWLESGGFNSSVGKLGTFEFNRPE